MTLWTFFGPFPFLIKKKKREGEIEKKKKEFPALLLEEIKYNMFKLQCGV